MIKIKNKQDCCGCGVCAQTCPTNSIIMETDNEGFKYPKVDLSSCISCNKCSRVCPVINFSEKTDKIDSAYVAFSKREDLRKVSSSGAVFSELAKMIFEQKGCVIGTAFDDEFGAKQICIDNFEDIYLVQGSKYIQSNTDGIFKEVDVLLKSGKKVLYVGTPCQVAGLKRFLGKDNSNLYTIDILCHGVPSPKVWQMYLAEMKQNYNSEIKDVFFRDKSDGWNRYGLSITFANGEKYLQCNRNDLFMRLFLNEMIIRPSCHACKFRKMEKDSDITIGDAWGIENIYPEMFDDKGCSLTIIHSDKGRELFNEIADYLVYKECNLDDILPPESHSRRVLSPHVNRSAFFRKVSKAKSVSEMEKYFQISIPKKLYLRVMKIIRNQH